MNKYEIKKVSADDIVFCSQNYIDDKLLFNYIEGAKNNNNAELYSDSKHVIICKKPQHNNVWIWTDDDSYNDAELVMEIAKTVCDFNLSKPQFFTKPNIAQIFSDMYALTSSDLDYQIKEEFSLGVYEYKGVTLDNNDDIKVQLYSKKLYNCLLSFYNEIAKEFSWENDRAEKLCKQCEDMNTYVLLKNSEILSLCSVSDNDGEYSSIRSVATKKEHRNKGYGSYVTNFAANNATKDNKKVMVYANKGNLSAAASLKKAGFSLSGEIHLIKS